MKIFFSSQFYSFIEFANLIPNFHCALNDYMSHSQMKSAFRSGRGVEEVGCTRPMGNENLYGEMMKKWCGKQS